MNRGIRRIALAVVLAGSTLAAAAVVYNRSAADMAAAATAFLASLSPDQRQLAALPFDSAERLRWHFIPPESFPRKGLTLKAMTEPQRTTAHELLRTGLSQRGYLTATGIMELEKVLQMLESPRRMARDHEEYFFSVFGTPAAGGTWGWRVEGHHLSFHFTIVEGRVVGTSPTFLGANPAEVRDGPMQGRRVLRSEEDAGRALVDALDPARRAVAIIATTAPNDILTSNTLDINPLSPPGLRAGDMSAPQRELLMQLIEVYTSLMTDELAAARLARLREAGVANISFAWAGGLARGERHYYRVQGPTFLIEYDNTQNNANHIHSVWRDFRGDFGRDVLREHVREVPHH